VIIPKIIHQTWKDHQVPEAYQDFQKSWTTYLPDWEYRLWTDEDCRDFLMQHYPWFLPIYDNYPKTIMRIDAVRYFWMYHYGGLYVDLDFEALKSVEPLLEGKRIVIGLEPKEHLNRKLCKQHDLDKILCNAFMASRTQEPFWAFVLQALSKYKQEENPLLATGPFFLTQCYKDYREREKIKLIPSNLLYPIYEGEVVERAFTEAYAIHHWAGTWWRHLNDNPKWMVASLNLIKHRFPKSFTKLKNLKKTFKC